MQHYKNIKSKYSIHIQVLVIDNDIIMNDLFL